MITDATDKITRIDILKMLFYAPDSSGRINSCIRGKTRLQKEVFLTQMAIKKKIKKSYGFMPYLYGPFSRQLYRDIAWLEDKGQVIVSSYSLYDEGIYREYRLTSEGEREVENLLQDKEMREIYEIVKKVKAEYDSMPLVQLVEYTHCKFPEYRLKYEF